MTLVLPITAQAASRLEPVELAPHRAIYEMTLDRSNSGAGIDRFKGRMVYELTGNRCEGYTQNTRFLTHTVSSDGSAAITDMRSSTWEGGEGNRFRFNSSHYKNEELQARVRGDAARLLKSGAIQVDIEHPTSQELELSNKVYFPVQHTIALLQAAANDQSVFSADLYEGSDTGKIVYSTTAIIGSLLPKGADIALPAVSNTGDLTKMRAWPIAMSYFAASSQKIDAMPLYEVAYRLYANGVSRKLYIDFGDYAVRGKLVQLTYFESPSCSSQGAHE